MDNLSTLIVDVAIKATGHLKGQHCIRHKYTNYEKITGGSSDFPISITFWSFAETIDDLNKLNKMQFRNKILLLKSM